MSSSIAKGAIAVIRPLTPYLPILPTPLLTLLPTAAFHYTTTASPTPLSFFLDPLSHPLHPPLFFTLGLIPLIYTLGLLSGNVSWVDRTWPFFTPLCSAMILLWGMWNPAAGVYGHNLPRMSIMMGLQILWSLRLLNHAIKRDFYDMTSEDYRYSQFRKIVPRWLFQLVHVFVIAIAQPLLLFTLSLPLHAALVLPPSELSSGPLGISIPYSAILPFLPARFHAAPPNTPVLHLGDFCLVLLAIGILWIEATADKQMYAFQSSKYASDAPKRTIQPNGGYWIKSGPKASPFPESHYPGFITSGLFEWTRHPNFAAEQLFWLNQALFVVVAGESSRVTRSGWIGGSIFGPCFALSLLFCASTFLTEWITQRKYPVYASYRQLVGQFVPQETAMLWLWNMTKGGRRELRERVFSHNPANPTTT